MATRDAQGKTVAGRRLRCFRVRAASVLSSAESWKAYLRIARIEHRSVYAGSSGRIRKSAAKFTPYAHQKTNNFP